MVKIWNFYLTYSIILDIDSMASKEIKDIFYDNVFNSFKSSVKNIQENTVITNQNERYIIPELEVDGTIEKDVKAESEKYKIN